MESVCRGNSTVGSNPTLSARFLAKPSAERCQSGRSGRSRKPLCSQGYRGFESHPLRHLFFDLVGRPKLESRDEGRLLDLAIPRRQARRRIPNDRDGRRKGGSSEAYVPAEQSPAQEDPRFSRAHEHQERPQGALPPPRQRAQASHRLKPCRSLPPEGASGSAVPRRSAARRSTSAATRTARGATARSSSSTS